MNSQKLKQKFVNFIMKKWTCPTICGICILLIFAMSANSFAKYYTRLQEERAASVAVFGSSINNDEQFWTRGYVLVSGVSGYIADNNIEMTNNMADGCVRIHMGAISPVTVGGTSYQAVPYPTNKEYQFNITNSANGKICEVALEYTITIEFPDVMPKGVTWTLKKANADGSGVSDITGLTTTELTYSQGNYYVLGRRFSSSTFTLAAGVAETDTYIIQFADSGVDYEAVDKIYDDMKITVTTTQISK